MIRLVSLLAAVALFACSDDTGPVKKDTKPPIKKDGKVGLEPSKDPDIAITKDTAPPKKDTAVKKDTTADNCGSPLHATSNSGKPCTADPNACNAGEVCVTGFKNASGGTVSMCLGKCCYDELKEWDDPFNLCPVADASKQMSGCDTMLKDNSMVCGWWCEWKDQSGTVIKKDCPNATDYDCIAIFTNYPNDKYCIPKTGAVAKDGGVTKEASTPAKEASVPPKEAGTTKDQQVTQ